MKKGLARCLIKKMLKKHLCLLVMLTVHSKFISGANYVDGVSIMTD